MSSQNTSEKSQPSESPMVDRWSRRTRPALRRPPHGPKPLLRLGPRECRFCILDAPEGQMDSALFCAAPAFDGAYCRAHRRRCLAPADHDLDALVAEIEAALRPRP
ncbi:MAG: hypothetical protein JWO33_2429 [Caulobacteraceae bacterium]|nr:hypothetical protein [Caulobacteraceae bacterium]